MQTRPVLTYGRPESRQMPAAVQWPLGVLLGAVVTLAAGILFAFLFGGGPVSSMIAAVCAPLVLHHFTRRLRRERGYVPLGRGIWAGAAAGIVLNVLFLAGLNWG
jgi:hypothetical protein